MRVGKGSSYPILLETTEALIREKGCQQTTLKEIMESSGLSKGAIYHYVKSKDELFGLVLKERLAKVNQRFQEAVNTDSPDLETPLAAIVQGMTHVDNPEDVTNRIFIYLLGKNEDPTVEALLKEGYRIAEENAVDWIEAGQENGVISKEIDAKKTAHLFIVLSYGLRVRAMVEPDNPAFRLEDLHAYMHNILRGGGMG
ncbi:TetR/AcrR family transcriptional regulator [Desmospora activa]|uniref:TetR family transcriptional regulator n=1 Tax=Desmospora activa DSM 45169 TaxID=1121389 RepID=A0A2T4ZBZ1_9BACL|nr:TetR/AcrR family transcriptional regulator [Desmospora activa]PTM59397.1 TetR family transcriptional regulator [Desmospora activa DSM 45169]